MKRITSILLLVLTANFASAQTDRKGLIPYDTINKKYMYEKVIEIQGKSANDLYVIGKKWFINKYQDEKFSIDENNAKLGRHGTFSVAVFIDAGPRNIPMNWLVDYVITTSYKDGKCKVEINSIKLTGNSNGEVNQASLESYEKSIENGYKGKKKTMQRYLYDLFKEIDANMKKILAEFEGNINGTIKTKEW